jgi:trehalose 6-phosphate phosphatase
MTRSLWEHRHEILARLAAAPAFLLALDFDGTLSPLVPAPDQAQLLPITRGALIALSQNPKLALAFISGRGLADLKARVGWKGPIYAGNHGLEISGPGFYFVKTEAEQQREALRRLSESLARALGHINGAEIEHKGLTTSVHYRRVAPSEREEVRKLVAHAVTAHEDFHLKNGNMVFEIWPRVDWDKGKALSWIAAQLGNHGTNVLYLGDDATDEDAFAALPEGITVKVGARQNTAAQFHLADHQEVQRFLLWLAEAGVSNFSLT